MSRSRSFRTGTEQETEHGAHLSPEVKNTIRLTLAFTKAVGADQKDKADNLVVSPYNALAALSMVAKGANGKTRDEMAEVLFGVKGKDLDASAKSYVDLNEQVLAANKGSVELTTANGIWVNKKEITLDATFAKDMKGEFKAEISEENFGKPTVDKINKWAGDNTKGLINEVLKELKPDDLAVLASALYFKGQWTHKFDKKLTEDKGYTQDGGAVSKTATMHQDFGRQQDFRIVQGKDFDAVALNYGEKDPKNGKNPTMRIVLVRPKDNSVSARDWLAAQSTGKVPAWLDAYAYQNATGSVELPRLDIKQTFDLIPAMQDMGMKQAFTDAADFSKMVTKDSGKLKIGKISHDTVFKTDEEGSEAAAVTVVGMRRSASIPQPIPHLDVKFDRSFAFALQDIETGAVLFMGAINKPNDAMKPEAAAKKPKAATRKR
ncbi:MAG: serpin family protein [Alphaproteobacteria bacterium]